MEYNPTELRRTASARESSSAVSGVKRKRDADATQAPIARPPPSFGASRGHVDHLQIDYLARRVPEDLMLVTGDEPLPGILGLIDGYEGVLQRNESMAANLGAKPLGQSLMKRFERLFDAPLKVVQPNPRDGAPVRWLDVVELFKHRPDDFSLVETRGGARVCQVWAKGSKVEMSEEDFQLIESGMPANLIPHQPIREDEEKELGTLEIMEKRLLHVIALTDAVSGKARKLNLRLKSRKAAITGGRGAVSTANGNRVPPTLNGVNPTSKGQGQDRSSLSPTSGFVAVNSRQTANGTGKGADPRTEPSSAVGVSAATRADLERRFSLKEKGAAPLSASPRGPTSRAAVAAANTTPAVLAGDRRLSVSAHETIDHGSVLGSAAVPIPVTPTSLLPAQSKHHSPLQTAADDGGPYKARMVRRVDRLEKGEGIEPPCDRCRRLQIECTKNLTACMGCTRKHAKCSWRDVRDDELGSESEDPGPGDASEDGGDGERERRGGGTDSGGDLDVATS
ncbi:MAG: hypothetical protein M1832_005027 [Thelocarpon impressellum]|nr:MAG: hypothetical protein M1832_005027 [Thelocarpon impressellum]